MGHTIELLQSRSKERVSVPCGSCRACCRDVVILLPNEGDNIAEYEHEVLPGPGPKYAVALKRKPDGYCVYSTPQGCSIWNRAPFLCRFFSCVSFFSSRTRIERRDLVKKGLASAEVFKAARRLLEHKDPGSND